MKGDSWGVSRWRSGYGLWLGIAIVSLDAIVPLSAGCVCVCGAQAVRLESSQVDGGVFPLLFVSATPRSLPFPWAVHTEDDMETVSQVPLVAPFRQARVQLWLLGIIVSLAAGPSSGKPAQSAQRLPTGEDLAHRWQIVRISASNPKPLGQTCSHEKICVLCPCRSFVNKTSCRTCGMSLDTAYALLPNQWRPLGVPPQVLALYGIATKSSPPEQSALVTSPSVAPPDVEMQTGPPNQGGSLNPLAAFPMLNSRSSWPNWSGHSRTTSWPLRAVHWDRPSATTSTISKRNLLHVALLGSSWTKLSPRKKVHAKPKSMLLA